MTPKQEEALREAATGIFQRKRERRRQMAKLSFEQKIDILVRLQNLASAVSLQARGVCRKPWWTIQDGSLP